jgi:hypothetical protein
MANYRINVGNVYERVVRNGNLVNKSKVTIVSVTDDEVVGRTASKKEVRASHAEVKTWKLLHYEKKVVAKGNKRLNDRNCVDVAIETILAHGCGMSAVAIVEAMKTEGTYKFKDTAKTPQNTVSSRLNSYINETENPKIKHIANGGKHTKGLFYPADYELPTETAEAVVEPTEA